MIRMAVIFASALWFSAVLSAAEENSAFKTQKEKVGYSIGMDIGNHVKGIADEIELEALVKGLRDALSAAKPLMTQAEIQETMMAFQTAQQEKAGKPMDKALGDKNMKDGEAFLAENKKKEGVITLPSGLQYKVIKDGTGDIPKATDTVVTNYQGTLIDGTEFDSSYKRGEPATFPVNRVIPGWVEALQLMKTGSKWQLFIPSKLAYGPQAMGPKIGPNSALIFDIELLSIQK